MSQTTSDFGDVERQLNSKYKVQNASKGILIVFMFIIATFIITIGPVRNYFAEAHRIQMLESELAHANDKKTRAMGELERLKDNKYITAYAREHYAMILPGETAIHIANPEVIGNSKDIDLPNNPATDLSKDASKALDKYKTPWYEKIYNSFEALKVDKNMPKNEPTPAETPAP
jgi:cell division protein FtsB